jgi:sialate O-acetylesterase
MTDMRRKPSAKIMIDDFKILLSSLCLSILLLFQTAGSNVRLPRLISDGMVLQSDARVHIWGWADDDEKITIHFIGKTYRTTAHKTGEWHVTLPELNAGGPYTMEISANNRIVLNDILIGDVWVCSGQSNMDLNMGRVAPLVEKEIESCQNPAIRRFFVSTSYDFNTPHKDLESGSWQSASPETILRFTAAGYFFARSLYEQYHVPIGLIHASVGGSPAEAWLSEDALKKFPEHLEAARKCQDGLYVNDIISKDNARQRNWYKQLSHRDQGFTGEKTWFDPAMDVSAWPTMSLPGFWHDQGLVNVNGAVWFRKEIDVPDSMTGKPAKLLMGRIVDADSIYINGVFIGTTSYQYPPRRYDVAANVLKPGNNVLVVRVVNSMGDGGFVKDKPYELIVNDRKIDLKGEWHYRIGAEMEPLAPPTFIQWQPLGLYNGMIAPLLNYAIKGVIWYQGEANTSNPLEYRKLFPALISDWRHKWQQGDFPFLYVQLANYMPANPQPSESHWAELREAQLKTLSVPNTGMAVTIDIGEWNDIHPLNKKDVGERLALAARKIAYSQKIIYSGPVFKSMKIRGNKVILAFTNTGTGLIVKGGGELKHFAIAGADHKFMWAHARIDGDKIVVWNEGIPKPVAVRYAWADNPDGANLYNREGLPASPFRTDD